MAATTALRIPARELISREELALLRERVEWKGVALIAHAWMVILGSIALVAVFPNPLTYIIAVILIGSRQLGLAILMHDGAHGCLSPSEKRNLLLSQWCCAYPLLWLLPLMTWQMVITRIRNIAEHAVVPDGDDPLRNTRTTKANLIERGLIAPYFVNYHLEHHLLYYVPCYNLPKLHAIMMRAPYAARMEVQPNYRTVLRLATAKPDSEDRPGEIVNTARRKHAGLEVNEDRASAGF